MDVKFPVDNYLRHLEAATDAERDTHAKAFLRDVRGRVKELSGRAGYIDADATLDEVLLFIPNESVWAFIHERDPQLIDVALRPEGRALLAGEPLRGAGGDPSGGRADAAARTSNEILECLAGFGRSGRSSPRRSTRWSQLRHRRRSSEDLTGPRRRQLERQLDRVGELRTRRSADRDVGPPPPPVAAVGPVEVTIDAAGELPGDPGDPGARVTPRPADGPRATSARCPAPRPRRPADPRRGRRPSAGALRARGQSVATTLASSSRKPAVPSRACSYWSSVSPPPLWRISSTVCSPLSVSV